jgi:AcrR family transcriptional regulator
VDTAAEFDLAELTLPKLARRLGVTRTAIYRYFPSKADLVAALVSALADAVVTPPRDGRDWQSWLREAAQSLRGFVAATLGPSGLRASASIYPLADVYADLMLEAGFTPAQAYDAYLHLHSICVEAAVIAHGAIPRPHRDRALRDVGLQPTDDRAGTPLGRLAGAMKHFDVDEWFDRQVALLVDALTEQLRRSPAVER